MSYILDALKKSEQERAQKVEQEQQLDRVSQSEKVDQVENEFHKDETISSATSWVLKLVYFTLVILSVLVLIRIFETPQDSASEPNQELVKKLLKEDILVEIQGETQREKQSEKQVVEQVVEQVEAQDIAIFPKAKAAIVIEQAPKELLDELPIMEISSHIYSTQANRRSIVVNNQRLVEGDFVSPGVQVQQITNQGMIVQAQGQLLIVNRSRGWGL